MKENKFRVWDKNLERIRTVRIMRFYGDTINIFVQEENEVGCWLKEGEYELMQFTGLKDKNGKEIWEGDVVSIPYAKELPGGWLSMRESEWKLQEVKFGTSEVFWGFNIGKFNVDKMEVLGNVWENPALMEIHSQTATKSQVGS